jgi:hypothetical protein
MSTSDRFSMPCRQRNRSQAHKRITISVRLGQHEPTSDLACDSLDVGSEHRWVMTEEVHFCIANTLVERGVLLHAQAWFGNQDTSANSPRSLQNSSTCSGRAVVATLCLQHTHTHTHTYICKPVHTLAHTCCMLLVQTPRELPVRMSLVFWIGCSPLP